MNRRDFIAISAAVSLVPAMTMAGDTVIYSGSEIETALKAGKTVFVRYGTEWCSTCAAQERRIGSLRSENPAYDQNIVFVYVDYDEFGNKPVTTDRGVPRRSTLLLLKGDKELARNVAGTSGKQIKMMLDAGLDAANS